jgi:hypothetical protein
MGFGKAPPADEATTFVVCRTDDKPAQAYNEARHAYCNRSVPDQEKCRRAPHHAIQLDCRTTQASLRARRKRRIIGTRFCRAEASEARGPEQGKTIGTAIRGF